MIKMQDNLEMASLEVLAESHKFDGEYKARIDKIKAACTSIYRAYQNREETLSINAERYEPSKVIDLKANLREKVRNELSELVHGKGFEKELAACRAVLESEESKTEIGQLIQVMREIEIRNLMRAAGDEFPMVFGAAIADGDPLTIEAIQNSPVPFNVDPDVLKAGAKRRLEIIKPILGKKFHLLREAQGTIESMADAIMPIKNGDVDPLREILETA